jgi:HEAT repeat protein
MAALRQDRGQYRFGPADTLRALGPKAAAAVPELTTMACGDDEAHSGKALFLLGAIGPEARPASPQLAQLRQDPTRRSHVDAVLVRIGGPAVDVFLRDLDPGNVMQCRAALTSLQAMGREAERANPTLRKLLLADESQLRFGAAQALAATEGESAELLAVIESMLRDQSPEFREAGARALGKLATAELKYRILRVVLAAVQIDDDSIREGLAWSLVRTGRATDRRLLPVLSELLLRGDRANAYEHDLAEAIIAVLDDPAS